ncbi:hypothetical protein LJK88_42120 [Paenibacillus sp. P26]|nr:hypothetical protein LJK88_42120 [Paenibacillus sp. P26]
MVWPENSNRVDRVILHDDCGRRRQAESEQREPASAKAVDTTPVTLRFTVHLPINEEFKRLYIEPVTRKYPHITLDLVSASTFKTYDQLIAAGKCRISTSRSTATCRG